ncbi:MAG: beta-lactamase family protein [Acidimicrobiaceae bacterium]|nr:beta-lactamase family protein [Acidimicrobiaceae bacterium]MBO0748050.1 beta-lactamase family protein [Acidimicrobiaceae bacterium]
MKVEVEPAEVGFDAKRLGRIEEHFRSYVDDGRLPGWLVTVAREGKLVYVAEYGQRDMEAGLPVEGDTIWRIYSMTKPITSLAAMMLWEQGAFDLNEPVSTYIPSFDGARVFTGGTAEAPETAPVKQPIRIWNLLSHTSGLSYGQTDHPVDKGYKLAEAASTEAGATDLAAMTDVWARQPLLFEPGTHWFYSRATDVLGRLIEVISGKSLDAYFADHILGPLQMSDTAFSVPDAKTDRLASLYVPDAETRKAVPAEGQVRSQQIGTFFSGGGGLFSTAGDYHRFCQMLLGGGELDGVRLVGPKTIRLMASNHLPGGADLDALAIPGFSETSRAGTGFGLGFSVVLDPAWTKVSGTRGEYGWGGAASTAFWIDPRERVTTTFFTQLRPSTTWPIRPRLHQLVYQALVEPVRRPRRGA